MKRIFSMLLLAVLLLQSAVFPAGAAETEKMTLQAVKVGTNEIVLTIKIKNIIFNAMQFAVQYDTEKLTPRTFNSGELATTTKGMADYLKNDHFLTLSGQSDGWMEDIPNTLDAEEGIAEYAIVATWVEDARKPDAINGLNADGYKVVGGDGLDLMKLHFTLKSGAVFTADSIRLVATASNPDGVCFFAFDETGKAEGGELSGQALAVRDFTALGIPLSETAYGSSTQPEDSDDAGGGNAGGGNAGGGNAGGGNAGGGNAGGGLPVEEVPVEEVPVEEVPAEVPADVQGHWAQAQIVRMMEQGLLSGYDDGSVRPEATLTRGQMSAVLCKLLDLQPVTDHVAFADVIGNWSASYVTAAYQAGLLTGRGGYFDPNDNITRQEICAILAKALKLPAGTQTSFPDTDKIADWAMDSVNAMVAAGLIAGDDEGRLNPRNNLRRSELSVIVCKAMDYQQS